MDSSSTAKKTDAKYVQSVKTRSHGIKILEFNIVDVITKYRYNIYEVKIMNQKLNEKIVKTGKSIYLISKETGIPYSSLNDIINGKVDVNKCSSETIFLLSLYLQCSIEDILNEFPLINGVSGKYKNIKYYWKYDTKRKMELHIIEENNDIVIDSGNMFSQSRFYKETKRMTELLIDYYLEEQEAKGLLYD